MAEWIKAILLGIVEGVTEFLPISSTGHLIIASEFLQLRESLQGIFAVSIQFGALIAVLIFYYAEISRQVQTVHKRVETRQLWLAIIVAFIPAAFIGLLFGRTITNWLFRPEIVAVALIIGGVMFIGIERRLSSEPASGEPLDDTPPTLRQALIVGLWQLVALIPGMSRSGMSIIGGMLAGLDRRRATQFSFYLALPTLGAAVFYTFLLDLPHISASDLGLLGIGVTVSAIVAWLSIGWLLRYVARHNFIPFGYYRIVVGIVILSVSLLM